MIVIVCEGQNVKAVMSQPVFSDWRQHACLARTTQPQRSRNEGEKICSQRLRRKLRALVAKMAVEMRARKGVQGLVKGGMLQGGSAAAAAGL
jgi:hypothetical protein